MAASGNWSGFFFVSIHIAQSMSVCVLLIVIDGVYPVGN